MVLKIFLRRPRRSSSTRGSLIPLDSSNNSSNLLCKGTNSASCLLIAFMAMRGLRRRVFILRVFVCACASVCVCVSFPVGSLSWGRQGFQFFFGGGTPRCGRSPTKLKMISVAYVFVFVFVFVFFYFFFIFFV